MSSRNGYSLIEILVVVGIVGLLAGTGVATYNRMNQRAQVEMEANRIAAQLRSWQKEADSGAGVKDCGSGLSYDGIRVTVGPSALSGQSVCEAVVDGPVRSVEYEYNVAVTPITSFDFLTVGKGVSAPVIIMVSKATIIYRISITQAGGIYVTE